jgi:hypothetical protein
MPARTKQSRKAAKLSHPLHRDLAAYALAAGAAGVSLLALAPPAEAQIVYTPMHELLTNYGHMSIDLNNDGVVDVTIREILCTEGEPGRVNSLQADPSVGAGFVSNGFIKAMSAGSIIGGQDLFASGPSTMYTMSTHGAYYSGPWALAGTKYLGIRFLIGSETHYGWARIRATREHNHNIAALLTGYAYEIQPNAPIRAGDTGQDTGQNDEDTATPASSSAHPETKRTLGALALGASPDLRHCVLQ